MAPIRSKLMDLSYSDPKSQIRLTGYADTVIIDSGAQQTISAIRFGGYPEVVRALSDAIYGGASVELKQGDTILYLECRLKGYRRLLSHDGIYAVATLMANDDSQTEENTSDDSDEDAPENPRKCFAVDRLERCLRALRGTVTLGIAQTGMLTLSTEDAFYIHSG